MKHFFTTRLLACLAMLLVLLPSLVSAAPFTPGNLVVVRIGDGSAVLTSAATATYLLEYTPAGVLVQTIALPTVAAGTNSILTNTGTSGSDALLSRSADGAYLVLTGYDASVGTGALAGTTSTANNRIIGRIAADGTFDTSTRLSDGFSTGNIRSATTVNGTAFYAVGSVGGVRYAALGNPASGTSTVISSVPSNNRGVGIYGGNLYVSSSTTTGGNFLGVSQVGTGLPTTTGQTTTALPGFPTATGPSPYGFYFADLSTAVAGVDVVYVADDRTTVDGGVQKWSLVGGTWTLNGTITGATATTAGAAIRGLNGSFSGTTVTLAASSSTGLYLVADNAGYNAAPSTLALPAPIATSITNTNFRGAAFAPVAAVATSAPTITSFTPASGPVGTTVTVTGTNFAGATGATLNGTAVSGFMMMSVTSVMFNVPAGATTGLIAVTTPGGTATSTTNFTVTPAVAAPTITSFAPARAVTRVGFTLNVSGTNLVAGTTINFNGVAYTGTISGTVGTSYNVVIPASGVPAPGTYPITATNTGGTSPSLSFLVVAPATTVAYENFEQGTKGSYTAGTVTLRSGDWTFTDALLGNLFNDRVNQVQSARIRGGSIAMDFDKPNGAGVITLSAAVYGADATASFVLEISTNGGTTYTIVPGAPTALTTTLTPHSFTVNRAGNVRLRISSTNTTLGSNPRINIDDIIITTYTGTATAANQVLPGLAVFPNPAADRITVALPTAGVATVALRDLTGRVVLAPATLGADKQLVLPATLARGIYLLEVKQGDATAVRRIEKN